MPPLAVYHNLSGLGLLHEPVVFIRVAVRKASEEDKQALLDKVDCFIFDCDGPLT